MKTFSEKVINTVRKIPRGKTLTYKIVAKKAGNEKAFRAVGNILNTYYMWCIKNGSPTIPCHRVVKSDGKPGGYVLGGKKKALLIKKEVRAGLPGR
jgi:methylated-DNA-[protein]-cysteine S-methyltransferase